MQSPPAARVLNQWAGNVDVCGQCDSQDFGHYWLPWADNEEIVHLFSVDEALPLKSDT